MTKTVNINVDPSKQRHTMEFDEDGNKVDVYDSGGRLDDDAITKGYDAVTQRGGPLKKG